MPIIWMTDIIFLDKLLVLKWGISGGKTNFIVNLYKLNAQNVVSIIADWPMDVPPCVGSSKSIHPLGSLRSIKIKLEYNSIHHIHDMTSNHQHIAGLDKVHLAKF